MVTSGKKYESGVITFIRGDKAFDFFNNAFMFIFLLVMFYPLYYVVIASLSDITQVGLGNVFIWPNGFSLESYRQVFNYDQLWVGYKNSLIYMTLNVIYNLCILLPIAYALSKKYLIFRKQITFYFVFTMYFGGGMIPSYLLITQTLRLGDTIWVMVLGGLAVTQMVVTRTFMMVTVPEELYESAEIDGANQLTCFFKIALPLSVPVIAVMALQFGVGSWNAFFGALLYINRMSLQPLQLVLRSILTLPQRMNIASEISELSPEQFADLEIRARLAESMKYSVIFIASAPLLMAYPFVQKYFVKGLLIGSLKG